MWNKSYFSLLLLLITIIGCKDEIALDSSKKETFLVVDGLITNKKGPHNIKLFLTSEINNAVRIPYSNCHVIINENNDKTETLTETEPGTYQTAENGINGIIGNTYQLIIETPDNKTYKTDFQLLLEPVEIDSLYYNFIKLENLDYPFGLPGYQFYMKTEQAHTNETYFLWTMEESFQYTADYKLYAIDGGNGIRICGADTITEYENLYRCWVTKTASYIFTGKTSNLTVSQIEKQALIFVGTNKKNSRKDIAC